jgi:histone-lysine N-methyltransferase SETMAR
MSVGKFEQRCLMKFLFLVGKRYRTIHAQLVSVLEENAVSLSTVKYWCQRFKSGNLSVQDEIRPGRPRSDLGNSISQMLTDEPFLSAKIIAKRLATSPHTIKSVLMQDLGMQKYSRRWIPHALNPSQKEKRVNDSKMLLTTLRQDKRHNFQHIMTGDESWFFYAYDSPAMYAQERTSVIPRISPAIDTKKTMITIFFTGDQLIHLAALSRGMNFNKEYFINEILEGIHQSCNQGSGYQVTKTIKIHMDNARVHNSREVCIELGKLKLTRLPHPPYSPDLSPCDFWFFGRAKTAFQNQRFEDSNAILAALTDLWESITFEELQRVFSNWIRRLEWVIKNNGEDYTE